MPHGNRRPLRSLAVGLLLLISPLTAAPSVPDLPGLRDAADHILGDPDNIRASHQVDKVFAFAHSLISQKSDAEAAVYLDGGLRLQPWNLGEQLALAQCLSLSGQAVPAKSRFDLVLKYAEDGRLRQLALAGLGQSLTVTAIEGIKAIPGSGPAIVLTPIGLVDPWLLDRLCVELKADLGVPVFIMDARVPLGMASRDPNAAWLAGTKREGDPKEAQWDADPLFQHLKAAVQPWVRKGAIFVGVTGVDLYSGDHNFQFGVSSQGYAVLSYRRFTADFNHATPNAERLVARVEKQGLTSAGFAFGVPRCSTPWCARTYADSLEQHDAKERRLCRECREGFRQAFVRFGWDKPLPIRGEDD